MRLKSLAFGPPCRVAAPGWALALLLQLAACSSSAATATSSDAAAEAPSATARPAASASATMPAGFPVMPGSEPVESLPDDPQLVARWTIVADGAQVYGFFVEALPAAGFDINQVAPGGDAAIIRFAPPAGPTLDVSLTAESAGTRIDLRLPNGPE